MAHHGPRAHAWRRNDGFFQSKLFLLCLQLQVDWNWQTTRNCFCRCVFLVRMWEEVVDIIIMSFLMIWWHTECWSSWMVCLSDLPSTPTFPQSSWFVSAALIKIKMCQKSVSTVLVFEYRCCWWAKLNYLCLTFNYRGIRLWRLSNTKFSAMWWLHTLETNSPVTFSLKWTVLRWPYAFGNIQRN